MSSSIRPAILLVDDDRTLLPLLARRLVREGYEVRTALSGRAALASLDVSWPALVVIDLMMPGMDGFELCRRVKQIADLPIIILSAVDASEAKVRALETYAEDYVTKPFDPAELVARVQRVMRRTSVGRTEVQIGEELSINLASRMVTTPAGSVPLTPTESRLLHVLIASMDHSVSTDTLLDRVWSDAEGADPSYVWVTVRRLRRKIEPDPDQPRYLLTDRGIGYRLVSSPAAHDLAVGAGD